MFLRKSLTCLLVWMVTFSFAQKPDTAYKKSWVDIDTLIVGKNLTKTALDKVTVLYQQAKRDKNTVQQIKCLIYQISLSSYINENDPGKNVQIIETEIQKTNDVSVKSVLYSLLANQYENYFNHNGGLCSRRSDTVHCKKKDITTWSSDDFYTAITNCYLKSLEAEEELKRRLTDNYEAILVIPRGATSLRPTLFDLLAHIALDYFKSSPSHLIQPACAFVINDAKALGSIKDFTGADFKTKDSLSHLFICLTIFQRLISCHKDEADALIDVNQERITWVYQQAIIQNKDSLRQAALEEMTTIYSDNPNTAQVWYLLARAHADKAATYQPLGDTANRYEYVKAIELINTALQKIKEKNEGTSRLHNLSEDILIKNIQLQVEMINVPAKPFRALVNYRNIDTLYAKIISTGNIDNIGGKQNAAYFWNYVNGLPYYKKFSQQLPVTNDYQQHAVEIKIDALPVGEYALLTGSDENFKDAPDKLSIIYFYVSNISLIKSAQEYYLLNRESGAPIKGASIKVVVTKANIPAGRLYLNDRLTNKISDSRGHFSLRDIQNALDGTVVKLEFIIEAGNDRLHLNGTEYLYCSKDESEESAQEYEQRSAWAYYFTDRAIYRPGQKVFFKGIAITSTKNSNLPKLYFQKDSLLIYLKDAYSKIVDSLVCAQNEYGSFAGSFMLPQKAVTGNFTIQAKTITGGMANFKVEEYKRPRFYVTINKLSGSYSLNDTLTVTGVAKTFTGNAPGGMNVIYNVQRNTGWKQNSMWMSNGGASQLQANRQIFSGTLITDNDGRFGIKFPAIPDTTVDKAVNPVFDFTVTATVTDANEETREARTTVSVAYQSLQLLMDAPDIIEAGSRESILVTTPDWSDKKEQPAVVRVKISSVQTPSRVIRERLWPRADQFIMNRKEYEFNFPNDDFDDDNNRSNWPVTATIFDKTINTGSDSIIDLYKLQLQPGYYKIEAITTDKCNQAVRSIRWMQVFSHRKLPYPQNNFSSTVNNIIEPKQTALFFTGVSYDKIYVIRQIIRPDLQHRGARNSNGKPGFIQRSRGLYTITYTANETDRGGLSIQEVFVKNSRIYTNTYAVSVPWDNKDLKINYKTYRDKTEPGSNEKWTVTVKGNRDKKVAAELLTTLYDASLDQLAPHGFNKPAIWPEVSWYNVWDAVNCFGSFNSFENNFNSIYWKNTKVYDHLAMQGEELWNNRHYYYDGATNSYSERFLSTLKEVDVIGYTSRKVTWVRNERVGTFSYVVLKAANSTSKNEDKAVGAVRLSDLPTVHRDINGSIRTYAQNPLNLVESQDKNFSETAFFFPQLQADSSGNYSFSFIAPESLTQWKWMSFAHTKDLSFGMETAIITTQKGLMVQPSLPGPVRPGDQIELTGKISNLSSKELTGKATLELMDATTRTPVDKWFHNLFPVQNFIVEAGKSCIVKFPVQIPFGYNQFLTWRIIARAGDYEDGEENTLPVLTDRKLND